nr:unnamed protein product [Callosobruchus analis]
MARHGQSGVEEAPLARLYQNEAHRKEGNRKGYSHNVERDNDDRGPGRSNEQGDPQPFGRGIGHGLGRVQVIH